MAATSGQLQTPRPEAGGSSVDQKAGANWNSKKFRDELDSIKSKVVDHRFDPKHYPDPLLPRRTSDVRNNPKSSTPDFERRVDQIIAEHKA